MSAQSKVMSALKRFLDRRGLLYIQRHNRLHGVTRGDNGRWSWQAGLTSQHRFLSFISSMPVNVPPPTRTAVCAYLNHVNWILPFGNFEMDWADGEVCFRTSIPCTGRALNLVAMEHLVLGNQYLMDVHLPGLFMVAFGGLSAVDALERLAKPPRSRSRRRPGGTHSPASGPSTPNHSPVSTDNPPPSRPPRFGDFPNNN